MLPDLAPLTIRTAFEQAVAWFVDMVASLEPDDWARPGLGDWNVRDLVGHTSRAMATIDAYLDTPADDVSLVGPVAYWRHVMSMVIEPSAIAERGRQAGAALGDDPAQNVWVMADALLNRLARVPDDAVLGVWGKGITLIDYLPSRIVELVAHTIDLCRALDREPTPPLVAADVAVSVLVAFGEPSVVLMALLGRGGNLLL